jgi:glycosyltransferase involved in cell wall biosynthesis
VIPVLHLRQGAALYGADRAVLALGAATLPPYRALVGAIARPGTPDELGDEARRRGLTAIRFDSKSRFDVACARAVAKATREHGVQLLHAHDFKALFVALVAGAMARVPVVATFHGDTGSSRAVRVYETFGRFLGNFTRGVVGVSHKLEATLRRWVRRVPVSFVPNGLPPPPPISPDERRQAREALGVSGYCVAVIGRLSVEKGHRVLLEALRQVPSVTLVVAGDGPLRQELTGLARGLDARFLGYVAEARPVFAAADVVAMPSLTEGLPLTALEALAFGRCLVASAVGELPDLLAGGAGVLVPPGDAPALAQALRRLESPEARASIEGAAAARATRYGVAAMAAAYGALYGRALASSNSSQ